MLQLNSATIMLKRRSSGAACTAATGVLESRVESVVWSWQSCLTGVAHLQRAARARANVCTHIFNRLEVDMGENAEEAFHVMCAHPVKVVEAPARICQFKTRHLTQTHGLPHNCSATAILGGMRTSATGSVVRIQT